MDLIRALIPYQNVENITALYNDCIKNLPQFKSKKQQKKAYRLLEDVCSCESEGCKTFLKKNRKSVQGLLVRSLETAAVSSKGSRLRCFNHLMKQQPQLNHESKFLKTVMTEAVICCKDINEKCRATAYDLLNTIGETLTNNNEMQLFVNMLLAGLIGTVQMMSATILALASVLHNFSGIISCFFPTSLMIFTCRNFRYFGARKYTVHPGKHRETDVGTDEGSCWLVLEFYEGVLLSIAQSNCSSVFACIGT